MNNSHSKKLAEFEDVVTAEGGGPDIRFEDFTAYVHDAEEGGYWAEVPALPGCITEGDTLDEVVANLHEAVRGWAEAQTPESLTALGVKFTRVMNTGLEASARLPRLRTLEFAA